MAIQLGDEIGVSVNREGYDGYVVELSLSGDVRNPESVNVHLDSGVSFTISWEQYKRGIGNE